MEEYGEGPMCRTCHVYVDNAHIKKALPIQGEEGKILAWIDNKTKNSRLACEVVVTPELSGCTVVMPEVSPLREIEI